MVEIYIDVSLASLFFFKYSVLVCNKLTYFPINGDKMNITNSNIANKIPMTVLEIPLSVACKKEQLSLKIMNNLTKIYIRSDTRLQVYITLQLSIFLYKCCYKKGGSLHLPSQPKPVYIIVLSRLSPDCVSTNWTNMLSYHIKIQNYRYQIKKKNIILIDKCWYPFDYTVQSFLI